MVTISEVIANHIKQTPFLEEALSKGLVNVMALARELEPMVEEVLMKEVEPEAVAMAIRRSVKQLQRRTESGSIYVQVPEMIVRSNLISYTVDNAHPKLAQLEKALAMAAGKKEYFFTFTQGIFETALIMNQLLENEINENIRPGEIKYVLRNLSAITIRLPEENVTAPGVYYQILKLMAWENVNLIDVVSTHSEFTLILDDKLVDKAFSVLKKGLTRAFQQTII